MKLQIGCGDIRLEGWVNIDTRKTSATDLVCDVTRIRDHIAEPVEAIYACHVLEHFGFGICEPRAEDVLQGWVDMLAPSGTIFLSVPDLKQIAIGILTSDGSFAAEYNFMRCLYGGSEYAENRHFVGFTRTLLRTLMKRVGLRHVRPFESFVDDTSRFVLHGVPISLNLMGMKA
jgi:predicted SAM-dependent methyltransferase